ECDVILLTDMKVERSPLIDTTAQIETFLNHAMRVYARGGTSLVPCNIDGVFFDLMENWEGLLKARQHPPIPIYVVSPIASEVCNAVFGPQWLCESKIAKICAGEPSFLHTKMLEEGQLKILPHVSPALLKALEEPCIIFMSDPSFRLGEAAGVLAQLEAKNSGNAVIGIDPQISLAHALAPYQPLPSIEVIHAPIDMRLSCNEANTLLVECLPQHLIVPACFTLKQLKEDQSVRYLHELIASRPVTSTNILHTLEPILVVKQHKKNVDAIMDPELAAQTTLTLIDKSAAALLQTQIELSQDQCILRPVNTSDVGRANKRLCIREVSNVLLGELNQNQLIQILENEYGAVHTQYQDDTLVLSFQDSVVTYSVHENRTSIASTDEGVRQRICQLIVAQLCVLPY
ncbi:integrator complex subunit, partial [Thraustotheca clavata]